MAVLTSTDGPLNAPSVQLAGNAGAFWLALPIVMVGAAAVGLLIGAPVLRLRGDYLAIVTLGFGEIARLLFLSDALEPWLGGVQGIIGIPSPLPQRLDLQFLGLDMVWRGPQVIYYVLLLFCLFSAFVAWRLAGSRVGRAWNAMREDEEVAEITGISTVNYKLLAFAMGAGLGCLSGALFAVQLRLRLPGQLQHQRLDHGAGDHHPGRHGQHPRRHRGRLRADRPARAACASSPSTGCWSTARCWWR